MELLGLLTVHALSQPGEMKHRIQVPPDPLMVLSPGSNSASPDSSADLDQFLRVQDLGASRSSTSMATMPVIDFQNRLTEVNSRVADLDAQQFSPTVILSGEVAWGLSGVAGRDVEDVVVFPSSIELTFTASFTGEDELEFGFESGNAIAFSFVEELTDEGQLDSPSDGDDHQVELGDISYEFPIGDPLSVYISPSGDDLDSFSSIFGDRNGEAISSFGSENPIYELIADVGVQLDYELADDISVTIGYFSEENDDEDDSRGLFNGNSSAFAQLGIELEERLLLGLTYIHAYNTESLDTEAGSLRSQLDLERPMIGNAYGISAAYAPSDRLGIGGWIGLIDATILGLGTAEVWNYAIALEIPDLGGEGNLLGLVIGQEPRLTGTSGFLIDDRRSDPDTSLHLETYYNYQVSEYISLTPGLIWITAPNHDQSNPDIVVLTLRTLFEF